MKQLPSIGSDGKDVEKTLNSVLSVHDLVSKADSKSKNELQENEMHSACNLTTSETNKTAPEPERNKL